MAPPGAARLEPYLHRSVRGEPCVSGHVTPAAAVSTHPLGEAVCAALAAAPATAGAHTPTLGAIAAEDGSWAWLARGSRIEVVDPGSGQRLGAFAYSASNEVVVRHGVEVRGPPADGEPGAVYLVLALDAGVDGETVVSVFDPVACRALTAVRVPHNVTAMAGVTLPGRDAPATAASVPRVCEPLAGFQGCVALGTDAGHVLLLDLRLDEAATPWVPSSRHGPARAVGCSLEPGASAPPSRGQHSLHQLGEGRTHTTSRLRGPTLRYQFVVEGEDGAAAVHTATSSNVQVTAVHHIRDTGTLAVGFAFGGFQLWSLAAAADPIFTAPLDFDEEQAVVQFGFQRAVADDYSFLWVGRSARLLDRHSDRPAALFMYRLKFSQASMNNNTFAKLALLPTSKVPEFDCRFEHLLGCVELDGVASGLDSRLMSLQIIGKYHRDGERCPPSLREEESITMAVAVWQTRTSDGAVGVYAGVLDLEAWMTSSEPYAVAPGSSPSCFFNTYLLRHPNASEDADGGAILDMLVDPASVRVFSAVDVAGHKPEEDPGRNYWRCNTSFNAFALTTRTALYTEFLGDQEKALANLSAGPLALQDPTQAFMACQQAKLIAPSLSLPPTDVTGRRLALLDVALFNNRLGLILGFVTLLTRRGETAALQPILAWVWATFKRWQSLKARYCKDLFAGRRLDLHSVDGLFRRMSSLHASLSTVRSAFQHLLQAQSEDDTVESRSSLERKWAGMQLHWRHVQLVNWFVSRGLLPENRFTLMATQLQRSYRIAREERLHSRQADAAETGMLMVDHLVAKLGLPASAAPAYPVPTLEAALALFLEPGVNPGVATCLLYYYLLDFDRFAALAAGSPADGLNEHGLARDFADIFELSEMVSKSVLGLWLLDKQEFPSAISNLALGSPLFPDQDAHVLRTCLEFNCYADAMLFFRSRRPSMSSLRDVKLCIDLFVSSRQPPTAFEYARQYRETSDDRVALLRHLLRGLENTGQGASILSLPFSPAEEHAVEQYLLSSNADKAKDLLLVFYLQRGRYFEAIRLHGAMPVETSPDGLRKAAAREALVRNYVQLLPRSKRALLETGVQALDRPLQKAPPTPKLGKPKAFSALHLVQQRSAAAKTAGLLGRPALLLSSVMKAVADQTRQSQPTDDHSVTNLDLPLAFIRPAVTPRKSRREETTAVFPSPAPSVWDIEMPEEAAMLADEELPGAMDTASPAPAAAAAAHDQLATDAAMSPFGGPMPSTPYLRLTETPPPIEPPRPLPSPSVRPVSILKKADAEDVDMALDASSPAAPEEEDDGEITINIRPKPEAAPAAAASPVAAKPAPVAVRVVEEDESDDEVTFNFKKASEFSRVSSTLTDSKPRSPIRRSDRALKTPPRRSRAKPRKLAPAMPGSPAMDTAEAAPEEEPLESPMLTRLTRLDSPGESGMVPSSPLLQAVPHRRLSQLARDPMLRLQSTPSPKGTPARAASAAAASPAKTPLSLLKAPRSPRSSARRKGKQGGAAEDVAFEDPDLGPSPPGQPSLLTLTPANASPRLPPATASATASPAMAVTPASAAAAPSPRSGPPSSVRAAPKPRSSPRRRVRELVVTPQRSSPRRAKPPVAAAAAAGSPRSEAASPISFLSPPDNSPAPRPARKKVRTRGRQTDKIVPMKHGMRLRTRSQYKA